MFKKTLSFTLLLALGMFTFPAFAADPTSVYLGGNTQTASIARGGTAGTTHLAATAPVTTPPPSGEINKKLVGAWNIGASMLQVSRPVKKSVLRPRKCEAATKFCSFVVV